jgi:hypothetical protein
VKPGIFPKIAVFLDIQPALEDWENEVKKAVLKSNRTGTAFLTSAL